MGFLDGGAGFWKTSIETGVVHDGSDEDVAGSAATFWSAPTKKGSDAGGLERGGVSRFGLKGGFGVLHGGGDMVFFPG